MHYNPDSRVMYNIQHDPMQYVYNGTCSTQPIFMLILGPMKYRSSIDKMCSNTKVKTYLFFVRTVLLYSKF